MTEAFFTVKPGASYRATCPDVYVENPSDHILDITVKARKVLPAIQEGDYFTYRDKEWVIVDAGSPGPGYEDEILVDAWAVFADGGRGNIDNFESELLPILIEQGAHNFRRPTFEAIFEAIG